MDWILFCILLAGCGAAAATGVMFRPGPWYRGLRKPGWTPPNVLFPIAWGVIYIAIAFAGARVASMPGAGLAMALWGAQIAFNTLWTPVFFGLHRIRAGLVIIGVLWVLVAACTVTFWRMDAVAGALSLPYLVWISYAAALNGAILRMNPDPVT